MANAEITKWDTSELKKMVIESLTTSMDMAGKVVEDDARKKLLAIKYPDDKRSANYRKYLANYQLTHIVNVEKDNITAVIGLTEKKYYGFYIEMGSSTAPAHPFLRPALVENKKNIMGIINK